MRALRVLALTLIGGLLTVGVVLDREPRPIEGAAAPVAVSTPDASKRTWFCAGGSGSDGPAAVALELVNSSRVEASAEILVIPDGAGEEQRIETIASALDRTPVNLAASADDSAGWVGAIVEIDSPDVLVEQTFEGAAGTDRAPCATSTATQLASLDGATRELSDGEQMSLLLMNPFREDAVADITFDADVGVDSLSSVVVPARRLVVIDVTKEVTVATRVHTAVSVISGRLVGQRVQVRNGENLRGLSVAPLVQGGTTVAALPVVTNRPGLVDRIHVSNLSEETAEVDLEIVTDGSASLDPIELTVRAGRTVVVDVSAEARLEDLERFGVVARSLTSTPVFVGVERNSPLDGEVVPGTAAMGAIDAAAATWLVPVEGDGSTVGFINPSSDAIATLTVTKLTVEGDEIVSTIELGPGRSRYLDGSEFDGRGVVRIDSSAPVVVARSSEGITSRQMASGIIADEPTPLAQLG